MAKVAISLPKPVVDPDWPQPGGYPNHAMQHLALPASLKQVWKTSVGEGSSRYTQILAQPIVVDGRVYAMDGGSQVGAFDASNGNVIWRVDVKPSDDYGNGFGGGIAFWKGRLLYLPDTPGLSPSIRRTARRSGKPASARRCAAVRRSPTAAFTS